MQLNWLGYPGLYDQNKYTYNVSDKVGWGLIQWSDRSRKQGLLDMANSMGSTVNDINVQLAYFKKEMETAFKTEWNDLKKLTSLDAVTKHFIDKIEISPNGLDRRKDYGI